MYNFLINLIIKGKWVLLTRKFYQPKVFRFSFPTFLSNSSSNWPFSSNCNLYDNVGIRDTAKPYNMTWPDILYTIYSRKYNYTLSLDLCLVNPRKSPFCIAFDDIQQQMSWIVLLCNVMINTLYLVDVNMC